MSLRKSQYQQSRRQGLLDRGLCQDCGEQPFRASRKTCVGCAEKKQILNKEYKSRERAVAGPNLDGESPWWLTFEVQE
jgi:ribosomal protein L37E